MKLLDEHPTRAVALAGFAAFLNIYAVQALLPQLMQHFHTNRSETSVAISATTLAVALASPFSGSMASLADRKKLVALALLGLTGAGFGAAWASDLASLVEWRFLQGLFLPLLVSVTLGFVGERWAGKGLGPVMARYVSWTVVGGFCGRFLAGVIAAHFGWRNALLLLAGLNGTAGLWLYLSLPRGRNQGSSQLRPQEWLEHLRNPALLAAFATGFSVLFSLVALFTYVTFYLAAPPFLLGSDKLAGLFCVYLLGVVVTPIAGRLMPRYGFRICLVGAACLAALGACLTLVPWIPLITVGLALASSAAFISQAATSGAVSELAGAQRNSALGVYMGFYYLGGSAGAVVPGWLWQWGGWPTCVALLLAMYAFIGALARRF